MNHELHIKGRVETHAPMSKYTSLKVGGEADILVFPKDVEDLKAALKYSNGEGIRYMVKGGGSNFLVRDRGIEGMVIDLRDGFKEIKKTGRYEVYAGAGARLNDVLNFSIKLELKGMEFLAGIPGTVGGAIVMNAGGEGGEMGYVIHEVTIIDGRGEVREKSREELHFDYRKFEIARKEIVLGARFHLKNGKAADMRVRVREILKHRKKVIPYKYPNAGSIFKNPPGEYAGRLLEEAGCKGLRIGGAAISETHANIIINVDGATANDVLALKEEMERRVFKRFGIRLEPEIKIVGRR